MDQELRDDLVAIILHEAFGYNDGYLERWIKGKLTNKDPEPNNEDIHAMGAAQYIITRMESRCSRIEG